MSSLSFSKTVVTYITVVMIDKGHGPEKGGMGVSFGILDALDAW